MGCLGATEFGIVVGREGQPVEGVRRELRWRGGFTMIFTMVFTATAGDVSLSTCRDETCSSHPSHGSATAESNFSDEATFPHDGWKRPTAEREIDSVEEDAVQSFIAASSSNKHFDDDVVRRKTRERTIDQHDFVDLTQFFVIPSRPVIGDSRRGQPSRRDRRQQPAGSARRTMGQLVRSMAAGRKASVLFRTLKRVEVEYNPYDHRSAVAR